MRRPMVAGNWKMNGSKTTIMQLLSGIKSELAGGLSAEIVVCPPFVYVDTVGAQVAGTQIKLGAQNVSQHASGAYTGEVAPSMLTDFNCEYVIVGHSERRSLYGESDQLVAEKFVAAQSAGLTPILCVGETLDERESNVTEAVVARQLDAVIALAGVSALTKAVVAYEPVWAIGTGRTATPAQAQEVHAFIRAKVASNDPGVAEGLRILYGGSVKASNAAELFSQADIDGGLIGGASLSITEFVAICRAAQ